MESKFECELPQPKLYEHGNSSSSFGSCLVTPFVRILCSDFVMRNKQWLRVVHPIVSEPDLQTSSLMRLFRNSPALEQDGLLGICRMQRNQSYSDLFIPRRVLETNSVSGRSVELNALMSLCSPLVWRKCSVRIFCACFKPLFVDSAVHWRVFCFAHVGIWWRI